MKKDIIITNKMYEEDKMSVCKHKNKRKVLADCGVCEVCEDCLRCQMIFDEKVK